MDSPTPRRRRTALVTSRWAASAAVIAAMTAGAAPVEADEDGAVDRAATTAFADPPPSDDA